MKTIFSNVTLKIRQILLLSILVLISAVGEMMLPSLLARMINNGVSDSSRRTILTLAGYGYSSSYCSHPSVPFSPLWPHL